MRDEAASFTSSPLRSSVAEPPLPALVANMLPATVTLESNSHDEPLYTAVPEHLPFRDRKKVFQANQPVTTLEAVRDSTRHKPRTKRAVIKTKGAIPQVHDVDGQLFTGQLER